MKPDDAEEWTQSLGQVMAGGWRQIALAQRLGVPKALNLTTDQWVKQRLGGYIRLSIDERRAAVAELHNDGHSQREIGRVLGVDHRTVGGDLNGEDSPQADTNDSDAAESDATEEDGGEDSPLDAVAALAMTNKGRNAQAHVGHASGFNEWYTPAEYIEAARSVLGSIDLDPASTETANTVVKAAKYYTAEHDGLRRIWRGCVWMNPPYAQPWIEQFAEKFAISLERGQVSAAIALVNNATETAWFARLSAPAAACCFPQGRVKFWSPERGETAAPLQGQALVYAGPHAKKFARVFAPFGVVLMKPEAR